MNNTYDKFYHEMNRFRGSSGRLPKLALEPACPCPGLTSEVGLGKIALIGELLVPPLLGGLIRFSFWRRLQNQTRITSFSILS